MVKELLWSGSAHYSVDWDVIEQSLTLRDVRVLSDCLLGDKDWSRAADACADEHDRHYGTVHRLTSWARRMNYDTSPAATEMRERALPRLVADRTRALDIQGLGPEFPADESHRRRYFSED
jgi:hypothetical protein